MAQARKRQETKEPTEHVCPVAFCPVGMFLTVSERPDQRPSST